MSVSIASTPSQSSDPQTPAKAPVYFVSLGCPKNLVDSQKRPKTEN